MWRPAVPQGTVGVLSFLRAPLRQEGRPLVSTQTEPGTPAASLVSLRPLPCFAFSVTCRRAWFVHPRTGLLKAEALPVSLVLQTVGATCAE